MWALPMPASQFSKASAPSPEPVQDSQMVIIVTVVSVLLFLFVTLALLCCIMGNRAYERHRGFYGVLEASQRLSRAFRL